MFVLTLTIRERRFDNSYNNLASPRSRALIIELRFILIPFCRRAFFGCVDIRINRFFEGSVGLDFDMIFESSTNTTNATIADKFIEANSTKELQFITLGKISAVENSSVILSTNATTTTTTTSTVVNVTPGKINDCQILFLF